MKATRSRMVLSAVSVCLFAVGMAGLLNFFKYRNTAERIVNERLVVTGSAVENSIQSSLALGLQFADLGMLPGTLERERATDDLILSIDVFDTEGKPMYSTDRLRATRRVPDAWLSNARQANGAAWSVRSGTESAAGIAIRNNFGLVIGYLALRYSQEQLNATTHGVARELAAATVGVFVVASVLASLALLAVMRGLSREFAAVEASLRKDVAQRSSDAVRKGAFGRALRRFLDNARGVEAEIAVLRGGLERGAER